MPRHIQISRYQVIWDTLKAKGYIKLSVIPELQPRLVKAIKKRRDVDLAFQHMLVEDCKKARLRFKKTGTVIEVFLITSIGLSEI